MPDYPDRPGYSFDPGPPPEVARFFANKGVVPSFGFEEVEPAEHAVSFTVAKMAQIDMLEAAKAEVRRAIDEGVTFEDFKRSWRGNPKLAEWWGQELQVDPLTGEEKIVQLGSSRRLRTIYRANLRSARAAGQWERIERTKRFLPFLEYRLGNSERHRPAHAAKEGLILPADDPFWSAWMPPNGWGCKCWVRQITRAEAERRGVGTAPELDTREWINPRTGESRQVPVGLDPSWDRNPGQLRQAAVARLLEGRLADAPEAAARVAVRDMATSWRVQRVLRGRAGGAVPVAIVPPDVGAALGNAGRFVRVGDPTGRKIGTKAAPVTPEIMGRFSDAMIDGPLVTEANDDGVLSLIAFVDGPEPWEVVVKSLPGAEEFWISTFHRTDADRWRRRAKGRDRRVVRE